MESRILIASGVGIWLLVGAAVGLAQDTPNAPTEPRQAEAQSDGAASDEEASTDRREVIWNQKVAAPHSPSDTRRASTTSSSSNDKPAG